MSTLNKAFTSALTDTLCKTLPGAVSERFTQISASDFEPWLREWLRTANQKSSVKKDANAPKRNKSAYLFFCEATRGQVQEKSPDLKMTEVSKEIGKLWSGLSEAEKRPYEKAAATDKVRYERELAAYKQQQQTA